MLIFLQMNLKIPQKIKKLIVEEKVIPMKRCELKVSFNRNEN